MFNILTIAPPTFQKMSYSQPIGDWIILCGDIKRQCALRIKVASGTNEEQIRYTTWMCVFH